MDANEIIKQSSSWKGEENVIGVINKRPKNLGDMLLLRKKFSLGGLSKSSGTNQCKKLANMLGKKQIGRPCASCPLMSEQNQITSSITCKTFNTPPADCKSRNLIYLADCQHCGKQYVGKTCQCLRTRISGHRTHVGGIEFLESDESTLAEHLHTDHNFDSVNLFNSGYNFTVLELFPHNLDLAEQRWISRLVTMRPFGLNKDRPLGVSDLLQKMLRKSLGPGQ